MSAYTKLLEQQLAQQRKDLEFYRGKCERLELALLAKNDVVLEPEQGIEQVRTEAQPTRKPWKQVLSDWAKMKPEEQDAALKGEPQ